jgi:hypothetical protein
MALKKLVNIQKDLFDPVTPAEYWVITKMESMKQENKTRVELSLFTTQETSKQPMAFPHTMRHVEIEGMDVTREAAYRYIKTLPNFNDAEDC